jgi:hypothetical protein
MDAPVCVGGCPQMQTDYRRWVVRCDEALLQSPMLRNILGQIRNRVSIPFTMDNRRISAT